MRLIYKLILVFVFALIISVSSYANQRIEEIFSEIEKNNLELKSFDRMKAFMAEENNTGYFPANPEAEFVFLNDRDNSNVTKRGISITQPFEFPLKYFKKADIADSKNQELHFAYSSKMSEIRLEAERLCIEIIYTEKMEDVLKKRAEAAENIFNSVQKKVDAGKDNAVDLAKARLEYQVAKNKLNTAEAGKELLLSRLFALNGGKTLNISGLDYPAPEASYSDFSDYLQNVNENNISLQTLIAEKKTAELNLSLNKYQWLPDFSIGYVYEDEPEYTFNGVKLGVSVPLFEHYNKVSAGESKLTYYDAVIEQKKIELKLDAQADMNFMEAVRQNYEALKQSTESDDVFELLSKSLALEQIGVAEYYQSLKSSYEITDAVLEAEKDYYLSLLQLKRNLWF